MASQPTVVSPQVPLQDKADSKTWRGNNPGALEPLQPEGPGLSEHTIPGNRIGNPTFYPRFAFCDKVLQHPGAKGLGGDDRHPDDVK